ncbi:MAG: sensor domain-containing diguanylate cyclase, partial [Polaromonas sp.]
VAVWPLRHLYPAFELVLQPHESQPSYLRVAHNYPISVQWTLSDVSHFQDGSKQWHLLMGVYIGLVLLIALMSGVHAVSWRDGIHLFYAGYVLVVAVGQLSLMGLGGEYFWPDTALWNDRAPGALTLAAAALLHLFLRQLVVDRDVPWLSYWLLVMTALGGGVALGFVLVGRKPFIALSAPYYLASMATYLGVAGWYAWRSPRVGGWVLAAMACLVGGSIFPILRTLSLIPMSGATQYGAQVGAALEIPLLLIALYFRSRERRGNQARVGALTRVDPLTGVASHRILLRRLEQLILRQRRDPGVGAVVRIRLGNATDLRHEYGMEAVQNAVVHAGACITGVAQEGDTVARHRDGDFVLVLHGHLTRQQLTDIGQRLIARGLAESPGLPPTMVLQLKLAVAEAPFKVADASRLLQSLEAVLGELAGRPGTALRFISWPDSQDTSPT